MQREQQADPEHAQGSRQPTAARDVPVDIESDRLVLDFLDRMPGVHRANSRIGVVEQSGVQKAVRHQRREVLRGDRLTQGERFRQALAKNIEQHAPLFGNDVVHFDALFLQAVVEARVDHAVLAFLIGEGLDLCQQLRIVDPLAVVAHASDEEFLAFRKQQRHGVEQTRLERITAEPVFGNVSFQAQARTLAGNDGGRRVGG